MRKRKRYTERMYRLGLHLCCLFVTAEMRTFNLILLYANSSDVDQPQHLLSMTRAFIISVLKNMAPKLAKYKKLRF